MKTDDTFINVKTGSKYQIADDSQLIFNGVIKIARYNYTPLSGMLKGLHLFCDKRDLDNNSNLELVDGK